MTFSQLIEHYGTQQAAAAALGLTQTAVANWKARGRIPELQQLRIQHATNGKLRADTKILPGKVSRS
jgi:hypothetical protein